MMTRLSVRPGMSTPWKNPAVANRQVSSSSLNAFTSAFFGRSRWVMIGCVTLSRTAAAASSIAFQLVNNARVRPPAAVMSAAISSWVAAARCGDRGSGRCSAQ
jgi:hypothetical protein